LNGPLHFLYALALITPRFSFYRKRLLHFIPFAVFYIYFLFPFYLKSGPLATENNLRGAPLAMRDTPTREAIAALHGMIDTDVAMKVSETSLQAPEWNHELVWFHGDLLCGNLLIKEGTLRAVIDFGALGVGDPACDLMAAWALFSDESRDVFRAELKVDETTWVRGRGHALSQAAIFIPYYLNTNPIGVGRARNQIDAVLKDYRANN
jgi:aminoglycoside phosphotransferase (APT) family kinase protein